MENVIESVRKKDGSVDETTYPFDFDKFNRIEYFKTVPKDVVEVGKRWLETYSVGYEAVQEHQNAIKEALKYSPVWCAGYAWYLKNNLYQNYGRANHCFLVYGYVDGSHWKVLDQYEPYLKKLAWNFAITYPKVLILKDANQDYDMGEILKLIKRGFKYIMRTEKAKGANGEVYKLDTEKGLIFTTPAEINNIAIGQLANQNDLTGISEADYNKLIV
jgi:hypothetical protein